MIHKGESLEERASFGAPLRRKASQAEKHLPAGVYKGEKVSKLGM